MREKFYSPATFQVGRAFLEDSTIHAVPWLCPLTHRSLVLLNAQFSLNIFGDLWVACNFNNW